MHGDTPKKLLSDLSASIQVTLASAHTRTVQVQAKGKIFLSQAEPMLFHLPKKVTNSEAKVKSIRLQFKLIQKSFRKIQ